MKNNLFWLTRIFLILCLFSHPIFSITPDLSFGQNGKAYVDFPFTSSSNYSSSGWFIFTQSTGRIIGLGIHSQPGGKGSSSGVARAGLTPEGTIDQAYNGGKSLEWGGLTWSNLLDAEIMSDGTVLRLTSYLSAPSGQNSLKLVRVSSNGLDDTSFSPNFVVGTTPGPPFLPIFASGYKFTIHNNGKISVIARHPGTGRFILIRFNPDGNRDATFGTNGVKDLPALGRLPGDAGFSDIIALPNDKIIIGGTCNGTNSTNRKDAFFARINSDGNMDYSFGRGGVIRYGFGKIVTMRGLVVQGEKYVLAGSIQDPDIDVMMIRVTARGRLDYEFGTGGIVRSDFTPIGSDFATAIALDAEGNLIIAGEADQELASPSNFLAARYSPEGVLEDQEQTFFTSDFDAGAVNLCIQPDGKILLIGYARNPNMSVTGNVFAIARYND